MGEGVRVQPLWFQLHSEKPSCPYKPQTDKLPEYMGITPAGVNGSFFCLSTYKHVTPGSIALTYRKVFHWQRSEATRNPYIIQQISPPASKEFVCISITLDKDS